MYLHVMLYCCICIVKEGASNVTKLFDIDTINTLVEFQSDISKNISKMRLVHIFSGHTSYMYSTVIVYTIQFSRTSEYRCKLSLLYIYPNSLIGTHTVNPLNAG